VCNHATNSITTFMQIVQIENEGSGKYHTEVYHTNNGQINSATFLRKQTVNAHEVTKIVTSTIGQDIYIIGKEEDPIFQASRMQVLVNRKVTSISKLSVKDMYTCIYNRDGQESTSLILHNWSQSDQSNTITKNNLIKALRKSHNKIISHKGQESLYKAITLGFYTGHKAKHALHDHQCPHCKHDNENNIHCLFQCTHISQLWRKTVGMFAPHIRRTLQNLTPWEMLTKSIPNVESETQLIWHIATAETIRAIWWKRTAKSMQNQQLNTNMLHTHIKTNIVISINNYMKTLFNAKKFKKARELLLWIQNKRLTNAKIINGKILL
jgi:hypothetical protein